MSKHQRMTRDEEELRDALTTIRRCWGRPDAARSAIGGKLAKVPAGSSAPGGAPTIIRASVTNTLAYWVRAAVNPTHGAYGITLPTKPVQLGDVMSTSAMLIANAGSLAGWSGDLVDEVRAAAADMDELTREPPQGIRIGTCPHEIKLTEGSTRVCDGEIRATERNASGVRCPRCFREDTVEQWQRLIVGPLPPMRTAALCDELARCGVARLTPAGIRTLVHRGVIPRPEIVAGHAVHEPGQVMQALLTRERIALGA